MFYTGNDNGKNGKILTKKKPQLAKAVGKIPKWTENLVENASYNKQPENIMKNRIEITTHSSLRIEGFGEKRNE